MDHCIPVPSSVRNLTGQAFGRWVILAHAGMRGTRRFWLCRCACGTEHTVRQDALLSGDSTSCGCWQRENASRQEATHHMTHTPEYHAWLGMNARCVKPTTEQYPNYGARGIAVCDRWRHSFENFYADMGPRPSSKHSLDRINNDGPYAPENCRWATSKQQCRNTRYNVHLTYNGRTQTLGDWAKELGISGQSLRCRLDKWPLALALTKPVTSPQRRYLGSNG